MTTPTQAEAAGIVVELLTLIANGEPATARITQLDRDELERVAGSAVGMLLAASEMRANDLGVPVEAFLQYLGLNAARWQA